MKQREELTKDDIAVFGGEPLFLRPRPIGQLAAPPIDSFFSRIAPAFQSGILTGGGPIVRALEERLAQYHGVAECIAFANAGLALILLMREFAGGRGGEVIVPGFGYNGLPHFTQWAGQLPRFCDVDPVSHGLDPAAVERAVSERTTSILAVPAFHDPGAIDELIALAQRCGVPIFFDSVNALGTTYRGRMLGGFGRAEVFSLHATKLLNGFEGGYITTGDVNLAANLRREREAPNARLNEVHAAMACASLDGLDALIERNRARYDAYVAICEPLRGFEILRYAAEPPERSAFPLVVAKVGEQWPLSRDETVRFLRSEGAEVGPYYSPALHLSPHAPRDSVAPDLPVAQTLARSFVQVPAGELMTVADIERLGARLRFVQDHGDAVALRLRETEPG